PTGARVTLIAPDGVVLADSEVPESQLARLENHRDRPEVRAALDGDIGRDLRRSVSVDAPLLYMALAVRDGPRTVGVLRLALPLSVVTSSYARVHRVLLAGGLLALAVAAGIGLFVAGRVTRPVVEMEAIARRMSQGEYAARAPVRSVDEIGALGRALNAMMAGLREKIDDLQEERAKATAILDGMVEGVIAVDAHECILLMNERARAILSGRPGRGEGKPPTAIQGYLETLLGGALHERANARRFIEIAFRHTERLGRLLNDLTDLSNIELGKVSLRLARVRFAEVLGSVLDIVRPKAES